VDVGAKAEIYRIMNDFVRTGGAILLISSEMEEILGMCDRVLVMRGGGLMADLPGDRLTQQEILNYALGTAKEIA
jgi:ABC-type sugar transport system ATPase subunit